jgi:hypothetical protein
MAQFLTAYELECRQQQAVLQKEVDKLKPFLEAIKRDFEKVADEKRRAKAAQAAAAAVEAAQRPQRLEPPVTRHAAVYYGPPAQARPKARLPSSPKHGGTDAATPETSESS